jgi:hypothetical protein
MLDIFVIGETNSSSVISVDYPISPHSIVLFSNFEAFNIFFFISVFNKY